MNKTSIPWTDYSSNPLIVLNRVTGRRGWWCTKVSPGCAHCYSERINRGRLGNGLAYLPTNAEKIEFQLNEREFEAWRKRKTPSKIFVCDMTDLFHEQVSFEFIETVWFRMKEARQHTFQILTKRADRMYAVLRSMYANPNWQNLGVPENVWLGVSVENQRTADERVPLLLETLAAVRFLSCGPLLEHIDLTDYLPYRLPVYKQMDGFLKPTAIAELYWTSVFAGSSSRARADQDSARWT